MVKQFGCWNAFEQVSLNFFKNKMTIQMHHLRQQSDLNKSISLKIQILCNRNFTEDAVLNDEVGYACKVQ